MNKTKDLVAAGHALANEMTGVPSALVSELASQLELQYVRAEESQREFRSADITMQNLEAKCEKLAAENAGLKASREVLSKNALETCNEIYCAGYRNTALHDGLMESTGNRNKYPNPIRTLVDEAKRSVETPGTDAFLAEVRAQAQSEVIEWLDAEITAIDTMYRGDPSYEHDAYWMKSNVLDVVELARKAFAAQLRKGVQS